MDRRFRSAAWALGLGGLLLFCTEGGATPADTAGAASADTAAPFLLSQAASAGTDSLYPASPAPSGEGVPYLSLMVKLGLGLALVILLAWGTVFLLKKSTLGQQFGAGGSNIRVMERFYLGPKKAIYLVEIGGRPLALGVTDESITALTQWQPGELQLQTRPAGSPSFAAQFRSLLGQPPQAGQEGG